MTDHARMVCPLFFLLAAVPPAQALTAVECAQSFTQAIADEDFSKASSFIDPVGLSEFRAMTTPPTGLDEEFVSGYYNGLFGRPVPPSAVAKLTDQQYWAAFYAGHARRTAEETGQRLRVKGTRILGTVTEGQKLVHVLTRKYVAIDETETNYVEVISLVDRDGKWRVLPSAEMESMSERVQSSLREMLKHFPAR